MKKFKKMFSLILVAAMVLSMNLTSFAAESGSYTHPEATIEGLTSITVGSTAASIEKDVKDGVEQSQIYARANLENSTEQALKSQIVTIETDDPSVTVSCDGIDFDVEDFTYTSTKSVNLLNTSYTITIGNTNVILAAGLTDGTVSVAADDPLGISVSAIGGASAEIVGTCVENDCEGNPDFGTQPWTNVSYQVKATADLASSTNLSSVPVTMTVADGATVSGYKTVSGNTYTFDLSGANPKFTVTNGGKSRDYYVAVKVATSGIQVTYAIDLTEVVTNSTYSTQFAKNCTEILDGAEGYFKSVGAANVTKTNKSVSAVITVPTGTNAMKPMLDLTAWAESNKKFTGTTKNEGTYLATLDGLGEFSCGQMSGWMYTDDSEGYSPNVTGPGVGAASYTMTNGQKITWYMTTNYFNHF